MPARRGQGLPATLTRAAVDRALVDARASDHETVLRWARQARALPELLAARDEAHAVTVEAGRLHVELTALVGAHTRRPEGGPGRGNPGVEKPDAAASGFSENRRKYYQRVAHVPAETREAYYDACRASAADVPTLGGVIAHGAGAHVGNATGNHEWYTPPEYLAAARVALGGEIDLDPASSAAANEVVRARVYYDATQDGLSQEWPADSRIWMNPPYEQPLIARFCARFVEATSGGRASGIALVNNATETEWFQELVTGAAALVLPKGRIRFLGAGGAEGAPLQGQAIVYRGPASKRFLRAYAAFGAGLLVPR